MEGRERNFDIAGAESWNAVPASSHSPAAVHGDASKERPPRTAAFFPIRLERENGTDFVAIVHDLSPTGLGGETSALVEPSQNVNIVKRGYGRFRCEIRWVEGKNFGLQFLEAVPMTMLSEPNR